MAMLVMRFGSKAPRLDGASLARAFALPGMWNVPSAPAILLTVAIVAELLTRWSVALPQLDLPQDATVRFRADKHIRRWAIWRLYAYAYNATVITALFQLSVLTSPIPLW
jgi:hypothetical protein